MQHDKWVAHMKEEAQQPREAALLTISHKTGSQKIPTFSSVTPGRCLPATVASLPTCPRTAALSLALCTHEFHRSPSCSSVLTCLHCIAILSLHTIPALCFSKTFFESHFLLSFSLHTIPALCFSKTFFESHFLLSFSPWNRLKSQVSCTR